jgi:hypothetical protein
MQRSISFLFYAILILSLCLIRETPAKEVGVSFSSGRALDSIDFLSIGDNDFTWDPFHQISLRFTNDKPVTPFLEVNAGFGKLKTPINEGDFTGGDLMEFGIHTGFLMKPMIMNRIGPMAMFGVGILQSSQESVYSDAFPRERLDRSANYAMLHAFVAAGIRVRPLKQWILEFTFRNEHYALLGHGSHTLQVGLVYQRKS